jgi:hypothetical protein
LRRSRTSAKGVKTPAGLLPAIVNANWRPETLAAACHGAMLLYCRLSNVSRVQDSGLRFMQFIRAAYPTFMHITPH